jgi:hypothetical protein
VGMAPCSQETPNLILRSHLQQRAGAGEGEGEGEGHRGVSGGPPS